VIELGHNIRRRRKELGLTQSQLAKGIISTPYLSLIENGKALPRPDILLPLAKRLQTSVESLMGVTDENTMEQVQSLIEKARSALIYEANGFEQAHQYVDTLRKLVESVSDPHILMKVDLLEINLYEHKFDVDRYTQLMKSFEEKWENFRNDPDILVQYLRIKGNMEFHMARYEKAMWHYKAAEKRLADVTDEIEKGYIYGNLGKTYLLLANPSLGILYAEKAMQIMSAHDRWLEMCHLLQLIGSCYCYNGEYEEALQYFERILRMCDQFLVSSLLISRAYHEIGICHMKLGNTEKAIHFLNQSLDVVEPGGLPDWEIGVVHQSLCQTYLKCGDLVQAKKHILTALELLQDRKNFLAECYIYLGKIAYAENTPETFVTYYMRAIEIFEELDIGEKIARAAHTLGRYFLEQGEHQRGAQLLLKASRHYSQLIPTVDFDVDLPTPIKTAQQKSG
jgi:tetratricopeptide (TPR) repeat protein